MNRRQFALGGLAVGAAVVAVRSPWIVNAQSAGQPYELPKLPYAENALAPYISAQTVGLHYGKHHGGYVLKLNELIRGTPLAEQSLEAVLKATSGKTEQTAIFNAAGQVWNHNFYWRSLRPKAGGAPRGKVANLIQDSAGGWEAFRTELINKSISLFGSGWIWLVAEGGKLTILPTKDADTPIAHGKTALLTIDVWEHAYYLDYQNRRKDYVEALIDHLLDWDFANENLARG
jgi:Fe-Mn family superoxide dismutase